MSVNDEFPSASDESKARRVGKDSAVRLGVLLWLAAVYMVLWGDLSIGNLLAGSVIGALIMVALPLPRIPVSGRLNLVALAEVMWVSSYYALQSSLQIAWFAVRLAPPPVSGVLRVNLSTKSDLVLVLTTDLLNLIPGTMVLEIDRNRCLVYVHVLDVGSEAAVARFYQQTRRLERLLISALERPVPKSVRR
ncbi:multicomponent Na+:H+ antiporter subunit E [Nocardia amikacinitolerans]|uniref:Multicomponent Na+:H+ antiporter subunit E n=1 Tax=Nocardia amikacinitolerans TaxID=756689 RepID=A0A285LBP9_9NOCA|nr:Na+/H+ antiporter subunit E [Nocardia amikacinitolerans]MCP2277428.1 multicomponent Na+:H+ antiporter subunit E [Nocardia amikacinitolerans]MCP2298815.1 multicomponent Na+:H+ antiporter subunit E [Nocardia amikacinitolerans]SNY81447.1 multicomponent Na+:H+ antiporter subunit E [Nocardia amikacinitolerans]